MLLLEYEGKAVLTKHDIPVPEGRLVTTADDTTSFGAGFAGPYMVKAQALTGGRGKAGGIQTAGDVVAARQKALALLGTKLNDQSVSSVLIEQEVKFLRERYLAVLLDGEKIILLLGSKGGVDVESFFDDTKGDFRAVSIDPTYGLGAYQVRKVLDELDIDRSLWSAYVDLAEKLFRLFRSSDATLAEINPLVETADRGLLALDAKIVIDDGALYRQPEFSAIDRSRLKGESLLARMRALEIQYVPIGGEVGLISSGAGVGVTIMDWLDKEGVRLSAFVDLDYAIMGGKTEAGIRLVLDTLVEDPAVRAIIVNFTTCGLRLDMIAGSLLAALAARPPITKPIYFHLQGNRAPAAHALLRQAGHEVSETLGDAVRQAARAIKRVPHGHNS